ncbi:corA-like mg2+ transporter protein domain-containing protein [Penicillium digitatum]|uniref:CorA-like mg2+ transporter protein domain-containing protein n=1 Tax=Penicillium digitatum TaxID=36651 RepID=A0A7T6XLA1_PENDI|nr:corA-like mg2+ transporter protein domain-containing protein [Penicillium digitatum]
MPRTIVRQTPPQTTSCRYLRRANLQDLLERLFPDQTDFGIQLIEDQWWFTAPRIVGTAELDSAQDE